MEKHISLFEDPCKLITFNNAHRRPDVGDADLWTADEIASWPPAEYQYQMPTIAPTTAWPSARHPPTQEKYDIEFALRDPIAAEVLKRMNPVGRPARIVVAGGAAPAPYFRAAVEAKDVNFFIVGLDSENMARLWRIAKEFAETIAEACRKMEVRAGLEGDPCHLFQILSPNTFILVVELICREGVQFEMPEGRRISKPRVYQLVLRAFASAGAVVHAFDIPSCCTFYNGKTARSTTLGAYAHCYQVNLVYPIHRSSYELHLRKYFQCGYSIGLLHLAPGVLQAGMKLILRHCYSLIKRVRGNLAVGTFQTEYD